MDTAINNRRGMTLVEIFITTIVLSIVLLAAGTIYVSGIKELQRTMDEARAQTEAAFALDHIFLHLMGAKGITAPTPPFSSSSSITVLTDDPNFGPSISYALSGDTIQYTYKIGVVGQTTEPIAKHITSLTFQQPLTKEGSADTIQNYVTIDVTAQSGRMQRTFSTGVVLRGMNP